MADVRLSLIETLTFPRLFALDAILEQGCPHEARFTAADTRCQQCQRGGECRWLQSGEPFGDFASRPDEELVRALRFAVEYIDSNNHRPRHRTATCMCQSCEWLQRAERLLREIDGRAISPTLTG